MTGSGRAPVSGSSRIGIKLPVQAHPALETPPPFRLIMHWTILALKTALPLPHESNWHGTGCGASGGIGVGGRRVVYRPPRSDRPEVQRVVLGGESRPGPHVMARHPDTANTHRPLDHPADPLRSAARVHHRNRDAARRVGPLP